VSFSFARRTLLIFATALGVVVVTYSVHAATVHELIEQGDWLAQTDEGFPDSFLRAVALYEQAAALDHQNPQPHVQIARACLALGDWQGKDKLEWHERGEQAAERALALKEDSAEAHFYLAANRGNIVNLKPFWKVSPTVVADLEKHLLRALELDPRHARALHMMGILLDRTPGPLRLLLVGKKEQIENYLTRAVEADSNRYAYIRWSLVEFYRDHGRPAQARAQAQALLAMSHPVDRRQWVEEYRPAAEALLRDLAARLHRIVPVAQTGVAESPPPSSSMLEERLEAVHKAPTDPRARLELGLAYAETEKYEFAMAELVEAIKLNPDNKDNLSARANFHLGLVLLAIDRVPLAINAFREALKLGWKDTDVYMALGQALTSQGKFDEAITQYREALRLAPNAADAHAGLGLALEGAGRVDEAIAQYELYLQASPATDDHSVDAIKQRLTKLKERRKM
jgi:tetratricopeptide (TPR) repeat protein